MKHGTVYLITNSQNGKRYIGQTVQKVWQRFLCHHNAKSAIGNAIRKYGPSSFVVQEIFIAFDVDALNTAEVTLIEEYGARYPGGYNLRSGGAPGLHSEHTKQKIAAAHLGKPKPPLTAEHKAKISAIHKGKTMKPDSVAKSAAARRGAKRSAASRQKMSESARMRKSGPLSESHKAKISETHKRIVLHGLAPSCIGSMGGWNKGVPHSDEHREKISRGMTGKLASEETKAKMRAFKKAWWEAKRVAQS